MLSRDPDWPELALYTINNLNTYTHKHTHTHTLLLSKAKNAEISTLLLASFRVRSQHHAEDAGHADNGPLPVPSFSGASFLGESGRCSLFSQEAVP